MTTTTALPAPRSSVICVPAGDVTILDLPVVEVPVAVERGWHVDPMAIHKLRWHDGAEWTEHVTHFGPVPCQHCTPLESCVR